MGRTVDLGTEKAHKWCEPAPHTKTHHRITGTKMTGI